MTIKLTRFNKIKVDSRNNLIQTLVKLCSNFIFHYINCVTLVTQLVQNVIL